MLGRRDPSHYYPPRAGGEAGEGVPLVLVGFEAAEKGGEGLGVYSSSLGRLASDGGSSSKCRTEARTSSSMRGVKRPVWVF